MAAEDATVPPASPLTAAAPAGTTTPDASADGAPGAGDEAAQVQQLRAAARRQRDAAEQQFREASAACAGRFFVNACLDGARSDRLRRLQAVRAQEVEVAAIERRRREAEVAAAEVQRQAAAQERAERQAAQAAGYRAEQAAAEAARQARQARRVARGAGQSPGAAEGAAATTGGADAAAR